MLVHHWSHATTPAGPGWDTVISGAVRLVTETGFSARAAVGEADVIRVVVDDPDATYDFKTLHRWYIVETDCPAGNQLVWNGYIGDQRISRGGDGILYPTGSGRVWELELVQENTILGLRIVTGTDGNRPAETAKARLTWLLASDYLSTVHDHGLIDWDGLATFAMDAVDYRGQTAADVLRDISLISGYNHYVRYNETYQQIELACYEPNTSPLDASTLRISNAAADIDLATTWPPSEDTQLTRQGSRVAAGVYLPYQGGSVYQYDYSTSYTFGFRDVAAPSSNVKTLAKANSLATRLLAQHATQDERVTTRIQLPAAKLNDVKHGQLIDSVKLVHAPGWTSGRPARVVSKTFGRPGNATQAVYDVDLELSPANDRVASFARLSRPNDNELFSGAGYDITARMHWDNDGDNPAAGTQQQPKYGLLDYYPRPKPSIGWQGIQCGGSGRVSILFVADFIAVVSGNCTARFEIRVNGTVVGSQSFTYSGGLGSWAPGCNFTVSDALVHEGDIVEGWLVFVGPYQNFFTIPAGTGNVTHQLTVSGTIAQP